MIDLDAMFPGWRTGGIFTVAVGAAYTILRLRNTIAKSDTEASGEADKRALGKLRVQAATIEQTELQVARDAWAEVTRELAEERAKMGRLEAKSEYLEKDRDYWKERAGVYAKGAGASDTDIMGRNR